MLNFNTPQYAVSFAIDFAVKAHDGQFRKGIKGGQLQVPYIIHPLDVMRQVAIFGIQDVNVWLASILHDVLEDTSFVKEALVDLFGQHVANIVDELTFRSRRADETGKAYQIEKSAHLADFKNKSVEALIIKIADRFCNVKDFMVSDPDYAKKYFEKASGLWDAFGDCSQDIIDKYGEDVYDKIDEILSAYECM